MDTLHTAEACEELHGGHLWEVHSHPITPDGWARPAPNSLYESWPSEEHALHCAEVRVKQGYRVTAYRTIASSAAGGE